MFGLLLLLAESENASKVGTGQGEDDGSKGDHSSNNTSLGDVQARALESFFGSGGSLDLELVEVGVGSGYPLGLSGSDSVDALGVPITSSETFGSDKGEVGALSSA